MNRQVGLNNGMIHAVSSHQSESYFVGKEDLKIIKWNFKGLSVKIAFDYIDRSRFSRKTAKNNSQLL